MIAFLIARRDHYRLLGPAIRLALLRGDYVQIWRPAKEPRKAWWWREGGATLFPHPQLVKYAGPLQLAALCRQGNLRAVYAVEPFLPKKIGAAKWIGVQFTVDAWRLATPDTGLDIIALHSEWWSRYAMGSQKLSPRHAVVGYPQMDQFHDGPSGAHDSLLYCPFPWRSVPTGRYLRAHDRAVCEAVAAFARGNGLRFVVKARAKDPVPWYLWRLADEVHYDRSYYPATIVGLMKRAALCVHHFSGVALEAAYAGVPSIAIRSDKLVPWKDRTWLDCGALDWPGVVWSASVGEAMVIDDVRPSNYPLDAERRAAYVARYIGPEDGKASARLLDLAG